MSKIPHGGDARHHYFIQLCGMAPNPVPIYLYVGMAQGAQALKNPRVPCHPYACAPKCFVTQVCYPFPNDNSGIILFDAIPKWYKTIRGTKPLFVEEQVTK